MTWNHDIFPMGLPTALEQILPRLFFFFASNWPSGRVALLRSETRTSYGLYTNSIIGLVSIRVEAVCTMWSTIIGNALNAWVSTKPVAFEFLGKALHLFSSICFLATREAFIFPKTLSCIGGNTLLAKKSTETRGMSPRYSIKTERVRYRLE